MAEIADKDVVVSWDGKDSSGEVVPDEAYSVRATIRTREGETATFDAGASFDPEPVEISKFTYSRVDGVLNYRLEEASRVHIQAGQARKSASGESEGPVLRTVVDRAPRSGGAVSESWTGFDTSKSVYIPDLPYFVMAILATPLPEASVITVGNRKKSYAEYSISAGPPPQRPAKARSHGSRHHQGLSGIEDRSPAAALSMKGQADDQRWVVPSGGKLEFEVSLPTDAPALYYSAPAELHFFVNEREVSKASCARSPCSIELDRTNLPAGESRLAVNWNSGRGPVAVGLVKVEKK
jgi:hypothetical protein